MSTSATIPNRIGQVAVHVEDVGRATAFYRDVVGLQFLFEAPPQLAFLQCGETRLMLAVPETAAAAHAGSMLYFFVDDVQGATERIRANGAEVVAEPHLIARMPDHDLWLAVFRDSEGNMMGLMSEVRE